ncbi:MAG: DUF5676 family membrane protein [bacterium]|nr:DUF5676 family membrane protein [bacterium]
MINTKHLLKVTSAWISVVYVVCFVGVALFPGLRSAFMYYGLHTNASVGENIMTFTTFVSGLVVWNIVALLSVGLFIALSNKIKA